MTDSLALGTIVKRGPTWKWDNEDGGEGCIGTVTGVYTDAIESEEEFTLQITWKIGGRNNYRYGDKYQDVIPAITRPLKDFL